MAPADILRAVFVGLALSLLPPAAADTLNISYTLPVNSREVAWSTTFQLSSAGDALVFNSASSPTDDDSISHSYGNSTVQVDYVGFRACFHGKFGDTVSVVFNKDKTPVAVAPKDNGSTLCAAPQSPGLQSIWLLDGVQSISNITFQTVIDAPEEATSADLASSTVNLVVGGSVSNDAMFSFVNANGGGDSLVHVTAVGDELNIPAATSMLVKVPNGTAFYDLRGSGVAGSGSIKVTADHELPSIVRSWERDYGAIDFLARAREPVLPSPASVLFFSPLAPKVQYTLNLTTESAPVKLSSLTFYAINQTAMEQRIASEAHHGLPMATVIGIIGGAVGLVKLAALVTWWYLRRRNKKRRTLGDYFEVEWDDSVEPFVISPQTTTESSEAQREAVVGPAPTSSSSTVTAPATTAASVSTSSSSHHLNILEISSKGGPTSIDTHLTTVNSRPTSFVESDTASVHEETDGLLPPLYSPSWEENAAGSSSKRGGSRQGGNKGRGSMRKDRERF